MSYKLAGVIWNDDGTMAIKELTPLEALDRICEHLDLDDAYFYSKNGEKADYKVVETALKEYEGAKNHIEALNKERIDSVLKLKALEIIKAHPEQLLDIIGTDNYNEYLDLDYAPNQYMSEENYYLVKEVLL